MWKVGSSTFYSTEVRLTDSLRSDAPVDGPTSVPTEWAPRETPRSKGALHDSRPRAHDRCRADVRVQRGRPRCPGRAAPADDPQHQLRTRLDPSSSAALLPAAVAWRG